jgi:hypothetical protein
MAREVIYKRGGGGPALGGTIWFIGWLFTWGFAQPVWWKILVGIIAWPYFLGEFVRHIVS